MHPHEGGSQGQIFQHGIFGVSAIGKVEFSDCPGAGKSAVEGFQAQFIVIAELKSVHAIIFVQLQILVAAEGNSAAEAFLDGARMNRVGVFAVGSVKFLPAKAEAVGFEFVQQSALFQAVFGEFGDEFHPEAEVFIAQAKAERIAEIDVQRIRHTAVDEAGFVEPVDLGRTLGCQSRAG